MAHLGHHESGDDAKSAATAANAAADAAVRGDGFDAAAEAARRAWIETAPASMWRPSFWSLLLTNWSFWALVVTVISVPFVYVTAALAPFLLIYVGWKAYVFWRLSRRGTVAPGSLSDVKAPPSFSIRFGRGGGDAPTPQHISSIFTDRISLHTTTSQRSQSGKT